MIGCVPNFSDDDNDDDGQPANSTSGSTATSTVSSGDGPAESSGDSRAATTESGTTSATRGEEDTEPLNDCAADEVCAPSVPKGWDGPFARRTIDAAAVDCGGDFPSLHAVLGQNLSGGGHECACACGPARGIECAQTTRLRTSGARAFCQTATIGSDVGAGCLPLNGAAWYGAEPYGVTAGSCEPIPSDRIGAPEFAERVALCGRERRGRVRSCGSGGVCLPGPAAPFEDGLCITRAGEATCPPEYADMSNFFAGFDDGRDCGECSCGEALGECQGVVGLHLGGTCTADPAYQLAADDQCAQVAEVVGSATTVSVRPGDATCTPSAGETIGELVAADPIVVCCTGALE